MAAASNIFKDRLDTSERGFSLPVALLTGFIILLGSLALAARSSWGIFGTIFISQNASAKEAAQAGMNYFVSELNRDRNRWLLVTRNNARNSEDPGTCNQSGSTCQKDPDRDNAVIGDLWADRNSSATILELRQNPCIVTSSPPQANQLPQYTQLDPNGALIDSQTGKPKPYGKWYIHKDGSISKTSTGATQSFQLYKVVRQPYAGKALSPAVDINQDGSYDEKDQYLSTSRDRSPSTSYGVGRVVIQVLGQSYANNQVIASIILEKEFELTPKCCGVPFGDKHGNVDYSIQTSGTYKDRSICFDKLGLGLLAGAAGNDTGTITIRGRSTDIEDPAGETVDPIYCLASKTDLCAINVSDPSINVAIVDYELPPAYTYCSPPGIKDVVDTDRDGRKTDQYYLNGESSDPCQGFPTSLPIAGTFTPTSLDSFITSNPASTFVQKQRYGSRTEYVIDSSATTYPSFCRESADRSMLHCNLTNIDYSSNRDITFVTGSRPLMLYFASGGSIISQAGNGQLKHCSSFDTASGVCTPSTVTTNLSIFGSNAQTTPQQTFSLNGTSDTSNMFFYVPWGRASLVGDTTFTGILWTNNLGSTGNPTWIIPASGLVQAYKLVQWSLNDIVAPPFFDFVLRGTNTYRWLAG